MTLLICNSMLGIISVSWYRSIFVGHTIEATELLPENKELKQIL